MIRWMVMLIMPVFLGYYWLSIALNVSLAAGGVLGVLVSTNWGGGCRVKCAECVTGSGRHARCAGG